MTFSQVENGYLEKSAGYQKRINSFCLKTGYTNYSHGLCTGQTEGFFCFRDEDVMIISRIVCDYHFFGGADLVMRFACVFLWKIKSETDIIILMV